MAAKNSKVFNLAGMTIRCEGLEVGMGKTMAKSTDSSKGIGYPLGLGVGSSVTQITSRTTGVTINALCGQITLVSAANSATDSTFTVTNNMVAAGDVIVVSQKSGTDPRRIAVTAVAAGSFNITSASISGTTTETPVYSFIVLKGSAT